MNKELLTNVINEIIAEIKKNSNDWFPGHNPDLTYLILALCGESGELANLQKKLLRNTEDFDTNELAHKMILEVADVFMYLMLICEKMDINPIEAWLVKRDFNMVRWGKCV